jgi:geranylgeranyl reductase family protein
MAYRRGIPVTPVYDAVVVGTGPAGSIAARALAKKGRSVLMLERDALPRPKACGGGLTGNIRKVIDFDVSEAVEAAVTRTYCMFRGRKTIWLEPKGLYVEMVQRDRFDHLLAKKAVEAGVDLRDRTPLRKLTPEQGGWRIETPSGEFRARTVIGADGAVSPTARAVGLRKDAKLGIAMDADIEVDAAIQKEWATTAIFDFGIVPRGYGWSFPKANSFSIGVGTIDSRFPAVRDHMNSLMDRHDCLRNPRSFKMRSAPIPFWTHHEPLATGGVFLAGDAAGLVDPLSGEGISYALRSGAAAAIYADAWLSGDESADRGYSREIETTISQGFRFALRLAEVFFRYPTVVYHIGVRSQTVNDIFARLIAGEIDYVRLFEEVSVSWPGKLYRALRPVLRRIA